MFEMLILLLLCVSSAAAFPLVFLVGDGVPKGPGILQGVSTSYAYEDPHTGIQAPLIARRILEVIPETKIVPIKSKFVNSRIEQYMYERCFQLNATSCSVWDISGGAPPLKQLLKRVASVEELYESTRRSLSDCVFLSKHRCRSNKICRWEKDVCRFLTLQDFKTQCLSKRKSWIDGKCA